MKLRLFWTTVLAFTLVIVLGVCGMLGLFGLAISGIWQPRGVRDGVQEAQRAWAASLGDYYVAHGDSWSGVDRRLEQLPFSDAPFGFDYALADRSGRIVASNTRALPTGQPVPPDPLVRSVPVDAQGDQVGMLLLRSSIAPPPDQPNRISGPPDFFWRIVRAFLAAGLGLVIILHLLAVIFARRLSLPLRRITAAAQALAAGQLDVQVSGASVRELDELSHAFNAMARSLSRANLLRRQMTADIAHELRTPLTIIKGRLEGLQDGVYRATPDQIALLLSETALLERLIEDLRLLALAETGQLPLHLEALDPRELLEDAAAAFAAQAQAHEVALRVEAPDDLPAINADPLRMAQVLANLVANALHHTPAGGAITLRAAPQRSGGGAQRPARPGMLWRDSAAPQVALVEDRGDGAAVADAASDRLLIEVCDTGQGIDAEDMPHIFERFWRADRARARASGGAGLGLAIARQIVVAHGGTIWAASAPGHGTTISITLPVAAD